MSTKVVKVVKIATNEPMEIPVGTWANWTKEKQSLYKMNGVVFAKGTAPAPEKKNNQSAGAEPAAKTSSNTAGSEKENANAVKKLVEAATDDAIKRAAERAKEEIKPLVILVGISNEDSEEKSIPELVNAIVEAIEVGMEGARSQVNEAKEAAELAELAKQEAEETVVKLSAELAKLKGKKDEKKN